MRWMRPAAMRWLLALFVTAHARTSSARTNANATSRLVFGSCSKTNLPQPLWPYVRARSPKAWIWAGDAVYGDRLVRALPLTFEAMGPQYLRDAYAKQNAIPEYARLREEVPHFIASWDDHDFGLNDGGGDLPWRDAYETQNAIPEYALLRKEVPHLIATWDDHDFGLNDGMISASRGAATPSRRRRASSLGEEVGGGLFFDLEAVRTATVPSTHRRRRPALARRLARGFSRGDGSDRSNRAAGCIYKKKSACGGRCRVSGCFRFEVSQVALF